MSDSVTVSVEVAATPDVAFEVFTRDIDAWYRVDADTLPDVTRTAAIRFEPHLGGRLLDVHDLVTGEGRELGRVTAWEPGHRLAFADNELTEVEVTFQAAGAGTRVTLTHRGLDRLAPSRAAQLRRAGWASLAGLYRDHLAPNARPLGLAAGVWVLFLAIPSGVLLAFSPAEHDPSVWPLLALLVALVPVIWVERRLVRRWLRSSWQYLRVWNLLGVLATLGLLIAGLHRFISQGHDVNAVALPLVLLASFLASAQEGPADGWSGRMQGLYGHRRARFAGLVVAVVVGVFALDRYVPKGVPILLAFLLAFWVGRIVTRRRRRHALGFDPDFYLAVERRVSDQDRRPELLVHHPSNHPEYSGWYAYASEQDTGSRDLVAWSLKDLIDHTPEAVRPLREGQGTWRWDQALHTYSPERAHDVGSPP